MKPDAEYLRAGEIARLLGISVRTVRRWLADETLPSVKLGGSRLVALRDLERRLVPRSPDRAETEEKSEQDEVLI